MKLKELSKSYDYITFLLLFMVLVPLAYVLGIISINTVSLWGRYFCFAIAAIGVDLLWGYTGVLCMCQAFFFCIGGYGIAMYMLLSASGKGAYGSKIPDFMVWNQVETLPTFWEAFHTFPITLLACIVVPALFAGVFGYFIFRSRLKGVYFAIITQALALAMWLLFLRNETMLGGTNGLTDFKTLLGFDLSASSTKMSLYLLSCLVLCLVYFATKKLVTSKFGKILVAIRDSESRIRYAAYNVQDYKLAVFVLAAIIAAIGGMLYVPQTGIITPGRMEVRASIEMIVWVALGGRGSLKGAVLGTLLVNFLYSMFTSLLPGSWLYVIGFLFIITVLYFNEGLMGFPKLWERVSSKYRKIYVSHE